MFEKLGIKFEKLGKKFEKLGKKFEKLGKKFEKIGKKFSLRLVINLKYGLDSTLTTQTQVSLKFTHFNHNWLVLFTTSHKGPLSDTNFNELSKIS